MVKGVISPIGKALENRMIRPAQAVKPNKQKGMVKNRISRWLAGLGMHGSHGDRRTGGCRTSLRKTIELKDSVGVMTKLL